MKIIEIKGDNYTGKIDRIRTACRAIIIKDNKLLVSFEKNTDQYQIPGGGLERGESDIDCVKREVKEETGYIIDADECVLEIDEYYGHEKFVSKYFFGNIISKGETNLTDGEKKNGMEPRWISLKEILSIFGQHEKYRDIFEERRGMYLREFTALEELL